MKKTFLKSKIILIMIFLLIYIFLFLNSIFLLDYTPHFPFIKFMKLSLFIPSAFYFILPFLNLLFGSHLSFQLIYMIGSIVSLHYLQKQTKYYLISSIILLFNPFVYSRIMVGQLGVLLAYLLLPVFTYYLFNLEDNLKSTIKLSITFAIISSLQPHFVVICMIMAAVWLIIQNKKNIKPTIKSIVILSLIMIIMNAYWLQGFFASSDTVFSSINYKHAEFFSPKLTQGAPTIMKIIGMWGFWREVVYITTYNTLPLWLWYSLTLMFPILMLIGYYTKKTKKSKFFYSLWWIGLILATGISHPFTRPIFDFLFNHVPFFSGFRDSHKFVALIALSYAYLCPIGINWITKKLKSIIKNAKLRKITKYAVPVFFTGLIMLYTYPLIGLWGQIKPAEYPESYQQTKEFLTQQNITGHIIYLPWEQYLTYNWTIDSSPDGRIAVPINKLVEPIIVTSPGMWGAGNELQANVSFCLNNENITCLEKIGVQYILEDRCAQYYTNYPWINQSIYKDSCISIHKINNTVMIVTTIKIPLRFIIGSIVSIITLISIIIYLKKCQ